MRGGGNNQRLFNMIYDSYEVATELRLFITIPLGASNSIPCLPLLDVITLFLRAIVCNVKNAEELDEKIYEIRWTRRPDRVWSVTRGLDHHRATRNAECILVHLTFATRDSRSRYHHGSSLTMIHRARSREMGCIRRRGNNDRHSPIDGFTRDELLSILDSAAILYRHARPSGSVKFIQLNPIYLLERRLRVYLHIT